LSFPVKTGIQSVIYLYLLALLDTLFIVLFKMLLMNITAQQLKVRGVTALREAFKEVSSVFIQVRGKPEFFVLPAERYNEWREYELKKALEEVHADIAAGRFKTYSVDEHLADIKA